MKRKILIVDDDPAVRTTVRGVLERKGFEVTTAADGCQAIALLAKTDYDMVLLDSRMPKLSGLGVIDQLRDDRMDILAHTYLLTEGDDEMHDINDVPVYGVIAKPFDISALIAETKDCIGH